MTTNRLRFQDNDLSFSVPLPSGVTGFTVLRAPKGTAHPTYISKGDINTFTDLFGSPSAKYPALKEALDFIRNYGCYVSAPAGVSGGSDNNFGGIHMTTKGSMVPFVGPIEEDELGNPAINYNGRFSQVYEGLASTNPFIGNSTFTFEGGQIGLQFANMPSSFDFGLVSSIVVNYSATSDTPTTYTATETFTLSDGNVLKGAVVVGTYDVNARTISIQGEVDATPDLWAAINIISPTGVSGSFTWTQDISDYVIASFYQSSIRNSTGTFLLNSVDLNPMVLNTENVGATFSGVTLSSSKVATFEVLSITGTAGDAPTYMDVGGVNVMIDPATDYDSVTALATKIATTLNAEAGWTVANVAGVVTITATVDFEDDAERRNPNYNTMTFTYTEGKTFNKQYTVSFDPNKKDASNSSLYVQDLIGSNLYIRCIPVQQLTDTESGVTWASSTNLIQGNRIVDSASFNISTDLTDTLTQGWNHASDSIYQDVLVFMEPEYDANIAPILASLRKSSSIFSTFIIGVRVSNGVATSKVDAQAVVNALKLKRAGLPKITGLAYYCNEMEVTVSGQTFWTIPVGAMASNCAKIMEEWLGGRSPSWTMESGVGGVLDISTTRQKYNFDKDMVDQLDAFGLNPITRSIEFGVMALSDKTAQDPNNITDWSYLGHSMAFDLLKKEIRTTCMIPQIKKPIDDFHIDLRDQQANIILNKRLVGSRAIWDSGLVDVRGVNTAETRIQKNFFIKIRVKVNPFSDFVTLILENVAQTASV